MRITTYEKGGNSLNPFIKLSIFLMIILCLFVIPVSAFDDSVQRYVTSYTEVWASATGGTASPPSSVSIVNIPTAYPTAKSIKLHGAGSGASAGWAYIQSKENLSFNYIGFTVQDYTSSLSPTFKIMYINGSTEGVIRESSFAVTDLNAGDRWELFKSGGNILLYINGVYDSNLGSVLDSEGKIKFYVSGAISSPPYSVLTLYLDDFSTSSIVGMNELWTQADTNIDTSYGIQSQSSFPTDEYTIKVTRPSTSETINTTSLGTGTTGDESGFVRWNRYDIFGSNFGLYQATIYRESDVLTNTYFTIFDITIQGSVDWEKDSYTIDESPAIGYSITNGDLSVYTYTLRVIDSLQQIKESYTLNSYSGIKGPNLAGYSTGTYYAVLSRKNKATSKVDDFAFDTVEISAEGVNPSSYINFGLDQYIIGDMASYTFNWADDDTSFWTRERIVIEKDGVILDRINAELSGTRYLDMDELGRYSISLISYGLLTYGNPIIHTSDSVECIEPFDSYINVPKTAPQRTNFTVNYLYGSTPSNGLILMKRLDETTGIYETVEFDLLDSNKQGGTAYSRNMSLYSTGTYKITLIHDEQVDEIYDVIEITSLYVPPIETVSNSSINSDKTTYAIGETIFAQYAVDYTNYTIYNVNMEVYNIDKDIISYSVPTIDQISYISQTIPITNEYFIGEHHLRLTSYDNTGSKVDVLTSKNITIGLVNDGGFGLSLSKYDIIQLELFVIKAISPTTANIRVWSVERDVQVGSLITINGSTYLNYAIPRIGNYEITLSSGGLEITKQYITVHEGFVDDGDILDEDDIISDTTFQDNTTSLLNSPYLIGLFIMCVFLAIGATNGIGGTIVTGSIGLGIVCYMGIFPWILLVIEVLVVAALMAKGMINLAGD